ncbi:MAG: O-antigen ligase family protein [Spirochaetia bacterium]|jgi:hypothetical protein|nr:O-antigen ligase family protein [Spirochaetia bacterium]
MTALLLFLPTLYKMPQALFLLAIPAILFRRREWELKGSDGSLRNFTILLALALFSTLNNIVGIGKASGFSDAIPFTFLHILTFFIVFNLDEEDFDTLLLLIAAEAAIVILQFTLGMNTFFRGHPDFKKFDSITYIYFIRPMGLSSSSSTVAFKLLCGLAFITLKGFKSKKYILLFALMLIALMANFNRTSIVAVGAMLGLKFLISNKRPLVLALKLISILLLAIVGWKMGLGKIVFDQFSRGMGALDLSYRDVLWGQSFRHIADNLFTGNSSYKYLTPLYAYNASMEHVHNSFIEMLATHGVPIFLLYIPLIALNIKKTNALALLPFLLLSLYQYGIFWGISFTDIVFFWILMFSNRIKDTDAYSIHSRQLSAGV